MLKGTKKGNYLILVIVFLTGIFLASALYLVIHKWENNTIKDEFYLKAKDRVSVIEDAFQDRISALYMILTFYDSSVFVERPEFKVFTKTLFLIHPDILSLDWIPRVSNVERKTFEEKVRLEGFNDFEIKELSKKGTLARSTEKKEYYPVLYIEPFEDNKIILGFDESSNASRWEAMQKACDANGSIVTGKITLIRESGGDYGCRVFIPVFKKDVPINTVEERKENLEGFISELLLISKTVELSLKNLEKAGADIYLYDKTDLKNPDFLYFHRSRLTSLDKIKTPLNYEELEKSKIKFSEDFEVAGRNWEIICIPSEIFLEKYIRIESKLVFLVALIITFLLVIYLSEILSKSEKIKALVDTRTVELRKANIELDGEIKKRIKFENELKRSNKELENFAYIASHDLEEPLRAVSDYVELLERRYKDKLDKDALDLIGFAIDGAAKMKILIDDLLKYSRVTSEKKRFEPIDLNIVLDEVKADLKFAIDSSKAFIKAENLPIVTGDKTQFVQLFGNLIANSIKFKSDKLPQIDIDSEEKIDRWLILVKDNGIGFDNKYSEKIFEVFYRLHEKGEYPGTGIGLSICKKIIETNGGKIWAESDGPGKGAKFYFTILKPIDL